jgi:hypothetical protein
MSILSKVKSVVKKATSNLVGNVKALTGTTKIKTYTPASTFKVGSVSTPSSTPVTKALSSAIKTNNSIGGVTTPSTVAPKTSSAKSMDFPVSSGTKVATKNTQANKDVANYQSGNLNKQPSGSNKASGGQVADSYSTSSTLKSTPSYIPTTGEYSTPMSTGEMSGSSAITTGTTGQTNAGLTGVSNYAGVGDKVNAYITDYEKTLADRRAAAEAERDTTLEAIQKELGTAAEDSRLDRAEIEKQAGLREAEQEASQIKSEILGIKAEFEAKRQSLIGQGRGIPEVIIGGQQEALDRQEAIKSMPLLARYQIATDNVAAAKETVANYIADEQAYLNRTYQTKVAVLNKAFDLAVGKEKDAVADFKDSYTNQIKNQQDANDLKLKMINAYLDNKQTPPNSLLSYDTSSASAQNDLMGYAGGITPQSTGGVFGNLPTSTQNKLINSAAEFNSRKEVQKFVATIDAANVLNIVDPKSKNPADHQAIVYGFAKALDPESVVRGEEYEAVKKYSQSLFNKYKGEIKNAIAGTGFLSENAIRDMQTTISNLYNARLPIYENAYAEKARTINSIAGANVADEIIETKTGGYSLNKNQSSGGDDIDAFLDGIPTN